jgi:GT2 family glycosyltransferase
LTVPVRLVRAEPGAGQTLATALADAVERVPDAEVVVVAPSEPGRVPEATLAALLDPALDIGAVVPLVYDERHAVADAGAALVAGETVPLGVGTDMRLPEHRFRRDVRVTTSPVVAVRAAVVAAAALDEGVSDPAVTIRALLDACAGAGLRIVYEPSWTVPAGSPAATGEDPSRLRRWQARDQGALERMLVVTGTVPGLRLDHDPLVDLIEDLARCPGLQVTLACEDGYEVRHHRSRYQQQGIEVVGGPQDWPAWCHERRYRYSHLLVTDSGLFTRLWHTARASQPQAVAILVSDGLPQRRAEAVGYATRPEQHGGVEVVADQAAHRLGQALGAIDVAWVSRADDVAYLQGLGKGLRVRHLPAAWRWDASGADHRRQGVALVATDGFDLTTDYEHVVVTALEEVVPSWRARQPDLPVTVVTDWPTPGLAHLAATCGATVVPTDGDLVGALRPARLLIAPVLHGLGAAALLRSASQAGTPWLATAAAVPGGVADALAGRSVLADTRTLAQRGWELLTSEAEAKALAGDLEAFATEETARRTERLHDALLDVGLTPPGPARWPSVPTRPRPARPPVRTSTRPAPLNNPPVLPVPDSLPEDERYALWDLTRGPTPAVVEVLAAEANGADYQPLISVLVPVYNTDPWMLDAAIQSLLDQGYRKWQLCLADDNSSRPETLAILQQAAQRDPRIVVTRTEGQSGISEATNAALAVAQGEFVGFLDHDDVLKPQALAQVVRALNEHPDLDLMYSDEDKIEIDGRLTEARWKPVWSPNLLLSQNYICHFLVVRRSLVEELGGLRKAFDGSQDYDLVLRIADVTDRIAHIPDQLYSWRKVPGSTAAVGEAKPYAWIAGQLALRDWLNRRETKGWTEMGAWEDVHSVRFNLLGQPKVSIIIPTRNGKRLLSPCVQSIAERSTYRNFELVVIDNQSDDPETLAYLATFPGRVVRYPHAFNYARQLNLAAGAVEADALLFLNNDTEIVTEDWIERLLEHALRPEVGAVGGRLMFRDGRVQHEGILVGVLRGHAINVDHGGWWRHGDLLRDTSAVTGACTMIRPGVYWRIGGKDERFRIAYNDVDLGARLHQAGYQVVYSPDVELFHQESSSRAGYEDPEDAPLYNARWRPRESIDPYYNPNLDASRRLFRVDV